MSVCKRAVLLLVAMPLMASCARDVVLPPQTPEDHLAAWQKWQSNRAKVLVSVGRPVSYTGLYWMPAGASTIGADTGNAIVLIGRGVAPFVGTLVRTGPQVRFEPAPGVPVTVDSLPAVARALRTDADTGRSSRVEIGTAGFRIIKRVDSIGVRTWDTDRASLKDFEPIAYFPVDPAWRIGGRFTRRARPDTVAMPTNSGVAEEYIDIGTIAVKIGGSRYNMTAYDGGKPTDIFLTFGDATNGTETYGFRFLHAALDTITNIVTLDLNYAYNPDCAFSAFTTCPLPPRANRLKVRVTAGELALRPLKSVVR